MRYIQSIRQALEELLTEDEQVYLLGEDILDPYGGAFGATKGLSTRFPDRVLTTPISEAGIVGVATGMAMRGLRPIVEIMFGDFITLIADQLINSASKFSWVYNEQVTVPLVIRTPMGGYRGYGPTHSQTLESIFLTIPGIEIVAPSHYHNPGAMLRECVLNSEWPTLFIENKSLYSMELETPSLTDEEEVSYIQLVNGRLDITIIAYGGMVDLAVKAAKELLLRREIIVGIVAPSIIKPMPNLLCVTKAALILEETADYFGWGALAGYQLERQGIKTTRMIADMMPVPASQQLEKQMLPQLKDVVENIEWMLNV